MKKFQFSLLMLFALLQSAGAQSFEFYRLPKATRHVPLTRFEAHQDTLFFFLESRVIPQDFYLAKFDKRNVRMVRLPKGYAPTRYHMPSYAGNLYMVLENSGTRTLFRYNSGIFSPVALPANYAFDRFEELELFAGQLYLGLKHNSTGIIDLFRYDGTTFTNVPLCSGCFIGSNPGTFENTYDEMIVYHDRLYIGGYLALDSATWDYKSRLFVYDGSSVSIVPENWGQWSSIYDQMFINNDLLHTNSFYGYDGTAIVPITYHYAPVSGIDLVENPWATEIGSSLGKTVYNGAVYYSSPMEVASGAIADLLQSRFYSFSTDPAKAREIFLPDGYQFQGFDTYFTHLQVFNCRLFMILEHSAGTESLVAYKESLFNVCDFPRFPWPFPFRFHIYPNPNNGVFTIELLHELQAPEVVKVFNHTGKLVLEKVLDKGENVIDISQYGKGLYTVYISNEKPVRIIVK